MFVCCFSTPTFAKVVYPLSAAFQKWQFSQHAILLNGYPTGITWQRLPLMLSPSCHQIAPDGIPSALWSMATTFRQSVTNIQSIYVPSIDLSAMSGNIYFPSIDLRNQTSSRSDSPRKAKG